MKELIKNLPIVGPIAKKIWGTFSKPPAFRDSGQYWDDRYKGGGNSGAGSYNNLAEHKAEVINEFVKTQKIQSVIEYGSGDGNQLELFDFGQYTGFDVSAAAVEMCRTKFDGDSSKHFELMKNYAGEQAELTMSLDVVYHLIEDPVFEEYMERLFDSATNYVIVYASNDESLNSDTTVHVRHRKFTDWVEANRQGFVLHQMLPNKYPFNGDIAVSSFADFYFFKRL